MWTNSVPFFVVVGLACLAPFACLSNTLLISAAVAILVAVALATLLWGKVDCVPEKLRPGIRIPLILLCLVIFWAFIQLLPLGFVGLANPIWKSASQALGDHLIGSVSVDTGATLIALGQAVMLLGLVLVTVNVASDRARAGHLLMVLVYAGIAFTVLCLAGRFLLSPDSGIRLRIERLSPASLFGVWLVIATAYATKAIQRARSALFGAPGVILHARMDLLKAAALFVPASLGVVVFGNTNVYWIVALALTIYLTMMMMRRTGLGEFFYFLATAGVLLLGIVLRNPLKADSGSGGLAAIAGDQSQIAAITLSAIRENLWLGTGWGTFASAFPAYRTAEIELSVSADRPPTAALAAALELGMPVALLLAAAIIAVVVLTWRGAFRRGRDAHLPAMTAVVGTLFLLSAIAEVGLATQGGLMLFAVIVGLGLAQIEGQTSQ